MGNHNRIHFARNWDTLNTGYRPENKPNSIFLHDKNDNEEV